MSLAGTLPVLCRSAHTSEVPTLCAATSAALYLAALQCLLVGPHLPKTGETIAGGRWTPDELRGDGGGGQAGHQSMAQSYLPLTAHPVPASVAPSPALDLENKEKQPGLWSQVVGKEVSLFMDM